MIDVFVSFPYTHANPSITALRVARAEKYVVSLLNKDLVPYSTITAWEHMLKRHTLSADYSFWKNHCRKMINASLSVHVLMLEGWETSPGVQDEIAIAKSLDKPIDYIPQEDI